MVSDDAEVNPYAPPKSESKPSGLDRPPPGGARLRRLLVVQVVVIVGSLAVEWYEHESIVGSGPIFALVGLGIAVLAFRQRDPLGALFGLSAVAFAGLIVFLINYNRWGPPQGDRPITILAWSYSIVALPFACYLFSRDRG